MFSNKKYLLNSLAQKISERTEIRYNHLLNKACQIKENSSSPEDLTTKKKSKKRKAKEIETEKSAGPEKSSKTEISRTLGQELLMI